MIQITYNISPIELSAAERRGTPVLLSVSVSDNFDNSPQIPKLQAVSNKHCQQIYDNENA